MARQVRGYLDMRGCDPAPGFDPESRRSVAILLCDEVPWQA